MSWGGHYWTLSTRLRRALRPVGAPPSRPWKLRLAERVPGGQGVELTGHWHGVAGAESAVLLVHGLGGSSDSPYMGIAASAAMRAGLSCLRLNLRGSDRRGNDFYHAGLTSDLHAALASPELASIPSLFLLGFSLGGHLVLRLATEVSDRRVRAVAAVCAPLDLAKTSDALDHPRRWLYRRTILASLLEHYRSVAARRPVRTPVEEARSIHRLREWDEKIVAPRFGFEGAADYYRRASVGPRLWELRVPALLVAAGGDPMVPAETVEAVLDARRPPLEVRWATPGGHVSFPPWLDLGIGAAPGLESQVLEWLLRTADGRAAAAFSRAGS